MGDLLARDHVLSLKGDEGPRHDPGARSTRTRERACAEPCTVGGMWELRVFGEPGKVRVPEPLRSASRDEEERTDVYFLFADTAPVSTPSRRIDGTLGLKLRSNAIGSKCELKRRYARDPNAVELWEKVFEHRLPLDAWWLSALLEHLGGRGKDALPPVTSPQDLARAC